MNHLKYLPLVIGFLISFPIASLHAQSEEGSSFEADFKQRYSSIRSQIPDSLPYLIQRADSLIKEAKEQPNDEFYARAKYLMGLLYYFNSQHYISQKHYLDAIETKFVKENPRLAKSIWNNIGINYDLSDDIIRSLDAYKRAADYATQVGDSSTIGRTYINRGLLYRKQRKFDEAREITFKALDYYVPKQDSGYIMLSYQNLAIYELEDGNPDKNLEYNRKALPLAIALHDKVTEHSILSNMANAYLAKNDVRNAQKYLNLARKNWKPNDWLELTERMWNQQAEIELAKGNTKAAQIALDSSKSYIERFDLVQYEDTWAETNLKLYAKSKSYNDFVEALEEYKKVRDDKFDKQKQKTFEEMLVLYEAEKLEAEKKALAFSLDLSNQRLWFVSGILLLVVVAGSIITLLYVRVKRQMKVLYDKAVENANKECEIVNEIKGTDTSEGAEKDPLYDLFIQIREIVRNEKLFLNPKLSVSDISNHVASNDKYVSQAINRFADSNFNGFLNNYRVKYASKMLIEHPDKPKEEVGEQSGFNSRSNFYRIFTQVTGLTPTEFTKMKKGA